jgi:hypothetical protein
MKRELKKELIDIVVHWMYTDPPIGPTKVIVGCNLDSLVSDLEKFIKARYES